MIKWNRKSSSDSSVAEHRHNNRGNKQRAPSAKEGNKAKEAKAMDAGREPDASRELLVVILVGTTEEVCGTKDGREHSSSINSFTLLVSCFCTVAPGR